MGGCASSPATHEEQPRAIKKAEPANHAHKKPDNVVQLPT